MPALRCGDCAVNVVITGANRGLGLGMAQLYAERGDTVFAGARQVDEAPELQALARAHGKSVHALPLDVTEDASCTAFARALGVPVDILINNAGVYAEGDTLDSLSFAEAAHTFAVNTLAPLRVTQAVAKKLRRPGAKVVHITSKMGSIADNRQGGSYWYRMSKAALNMGGKTMALQWQDEGITVALLHPGWVRTRMGGKGALLDVQTATRAMVSTIDKLQLAQSGGFFNYDGAAIPW